MQQKRKLVLWAGLGTLALLTAACFVYFQFFFRLDLFDPGPIKGVTPEAWAKLKVGMTKQEVESLLGESHSRVGPGLVEVDGRKVVTTPEFWQYTWSDGLDVFGPSDKAHVVFFDPDGRVSSFRAPLMGSTGQTVKPSEAGNPP